MLSSDPIQRRIHACVLARVPAVLWSPPGSGKTARVRAYAQATGRHMQRWLLSRCEPIDLKPRLYHEGKVMVLDPPEIDALVAQAAAKIGGIAFFDEFNRCTREVEGAALDRIDDPPANVAVIAACNPPSKGQAARSLESAAANRFCHLQVESSPAAWAEAQKYGWPSDAAGFPHPNKDEKLGERIAQEQARAAALASSYIARNGKDLDCPPSDTVRAGEAWPSARTWEFAHRLHGAATALEMDAEDKIALVCGAIGNGVGAQFLAFVEAADMIDPEAWLKDPELYKPQNDGRVDRVVATLTSLTHVVERDLTDTRYRDAWKILAHLELKCAMMDAASIGADMLVGVHRAAAKRPGARADKNNGPVTLANGEVVQPPHKHMTRRMAELLVDSDKALKAS